MTQENNRHGTDWTKAPGDPSSAPQGPGTESNRARAARGGPMGSDVLSVYLDGRKIAGAPMDRVEVGVDHASGPNFTGRTRMTVREDADGVRRWEAVDAPTQPTTPAPAQVWLPPQRDYTPGQLDDDGTLTIESVTGPTVAFAKPAGGYIGAKGLADPANGWTCIGVATPHGRVMVGDGWRPDADAPEWTVTAVGYPPGSIVLSGPGGSCSNDAGHVAARWTRTRYAPARAGERYRWRATAPIAFAQIEQRISDGVLVAIVGADPARSGRVMELSAIGNLNPAQWERLDPGSPIQTAPTDEDIREQILACIPLDPHPTATAVQSAAAIIARTMPVAFTDVEWSIHRVVRADIGDMQDMAMRWAHTPFADCNPLTATGEALRALGKLFSAEPALPERGTLAQATSLANVLRAKLREPSGVLAAMPIQRVGAADREPDSNLRARCRVVERGRAFKAPHLDTATGAALDAIASGMGVARRAPVQPQGNAGPPAFGDSRTDGPPSYDVAPDGTITRIHLAAGQTFVSGRGTRPDLRRYTLTRRVDSVPIPETWATEEGPRVTEPFARESCRYVGMKADLLAGAERAMRGAVDVADGGVYEPALDATPRSRCVTVPITSAMRDAAATALDAPTTLTLQAPASDLRALADAIGRALESDGPHHARFVEVVVRVQRDELLFTPTWSTGIGASLCGDARALCALRSAVGDAMATGRATLAQWGAKGPALVVRREGPAPAAPVEPADATPTSYAGQDGGADQWRWTPRGEGC